MAAETTGGGGRIGLRERLHRQLDPAARPRGLSWLNRLLIALIVMACAAAVLETEPAIGRRFHTPFLAAEVVFGAVFSAEYLLRAWVATRPGGVGLLRHLASPMALLDLAAILPSLLAFGGGSTLLLRLFRVLRVLRLARLGRFSKALGHMATAIKARRDELLVTLLFGACVLVMAATLLHLVEGERQPEGFGSIPRAMWWAVVTMTTIGYGDVYPVTAAGRVLAGITALFGIGLIAMPTGILAAAFSDAVQARRAAEAEAELDLLTEEPPLADPADDEASRPLRP